MYRQTLLYHVDHMKWTKTSDGTLAPSAQQANVSSAKGCAVFVAQVLEQQTNLDEDNN